MNARTNGGMVDLRCWNEWHGVGEPRLEHVSGSCCGYCLRWRCPGPRLFYVAWR